MRKNIKSVLALVLVALLALAGVSAFAENDTYKLTLNNTGKTEHTFELYKVFKGDLSGSTLSNIEWAEGISADGQTAAYGMATGLDSARKVAEYLSDGNDDEKAAKAAAFAQIVGQNLGTKTKVGTTEEWKAEAGKSVEASGLTPGYYFVKDKASSQETGKEGAYTGYILEVVKDTTANTKIDVPTVEKKVKEKNDITGVETGWQDAADYDIGDSIPYQITGKLPGNFDKYDTYKKFTFTDTLSAGLTPPAAKDVSVKFGDVDLVEKGIFQVDVTDQKITVSLQSNVDLTKVKVSDADAAALMFSNGSEIVVSYNATLNNNAVTGSAGNPNTVDLQYSNNPNKGGDGDYGTTPKDKVTVFTYEIDVNKVEPDGKETITKVQYDAIEDAAVKATYTEDAGSDPKTYSRDKTKALSGAGFTLYKKVPVATPGAVEGYIAVDNEIKGVTTFEFKGTDAGEYKLVETTIPAGYNKAADVEFKVEAKYDTDSADPKLLELKVTPESAKFTVSITETKTKTVTDPETNEVSNVVTEITTDGKAVTDILNQKGSTLPSTGGIGTTIFYIGGSILVLAAVILLVTKRRMGAND